MVKMFAISFRLSPAEQAALRAWAMQRAPDAVPSIHTTAKAIVLQRLVRDGVLSADGKAVVRLPTPPRKRVTGEDLRNARKNHGLTQEKLADIFQVPRATLAKWETGTKRVPARLISVVLKWMDTGERPGEQELERRERRTAWQHLLEDKLIGEDD